jgi:phosphoglucosamine mutase
VTLPGKRPLAELPKTSRAIASAEKALGKNGRVLVRWSGTEPKLRVMIEGPKQDRIEAMANGIAAEAKKEFKAAK